MPTPTPSPDFQSRLAAFPATFGLIGFTLAIYTGQLLSLQILGGDVLLSLGAKDPSALAAGQVWRLVTPIFLHLGLWHIFVNMYSLYALGPAVERFFGGRRMFSFYMISGISGVVLSLAMSENISVGASGSIFGMLGALAAFLYHHRDVFGRVGMAQFRHLLFVAALNLAIGFAPGIDNWGHLGGMLAGAALTTLLGPELRAHWGEGEAPTLVDRRPWRAVQPGTLLSLVTVIVLGFLLGTLVP